MNPQKVFVIGLDCATPQLLFDEYLDHLPNIKNLLNKSTWGKLQSTVPPITCPAWMCMMTGKTPGELGCYGFRNRRNHDYDSFKMINSMDIREDALWDIIGEEGGESLVIGVPPTYPPKKIRGHMISGFLTPSVSSPYTYPPEFKEEIPKTVGEYLFDVPNFRTDHKEDLLKQIYAMTEQRFKLVRHLLENKTWDFFMFVEMGIDRIHHGFWKFIDRTHPKYVAGNPYENVVLEYYQYLDQEIGKLDQLLDDQTVRLIVSDHGAQKLLGGLCINEWLIKEGYLTLKEYPNEITVLNPEMIDWSKTKAWSEGGYYARIFFNVADREPQGIIQPGEYESLREELRERLQDIQDHQGQSIGTRVFKPEDVYPVCEGVAPDLIVYLGNLYYRSIGTVGYHDVWVNDNDTGPDDANHAEQGIFILYDPQDQNSQNLDRSIYDIAPTVLNRMGISIPQDMKGTVI